MLNYGDYVAIIYASLQTFGLLSTSIYVLIKSSSSGCCERAKEIWSYKWIYISTLSTIYDQATDIGVLIYWYSLIGDKDVEHVDMTLLFVLSCVFIGISRFITFALGSTNIKSQVLAVFLGVFDLLITAFVWGKVTGTTNVFALMYAGEDEISVISQLQFMEVLFESLPQILLQSLFLIRTFNNDALYADQDNEFNIFLVWISLLISVISATNKISHQFMTSGGQSSGRNKVKNKYNIRRKCPVINIGILSKKIFYASTTVTRLFIYSLLWAVVGGMFVSLFVIICFIVHMICCKCGFYGNFTGDLEWLGFLFFEAFGFATQDSDEMAGWHGSHGPRRFRIHNMFNLLGLILVSYFGMDDSFDCDSNLCADSKIRSFNHNTFVIVLFFAVIGTFILQIVLYFSIPKFEHLSNKWERLYQRKKHNIKTNIGPSIYAIRTKQMQDAMAKNAKALQENQQASPKLTTEEIAQWINYQKTQDMINQRWPDLKATPQEKRVDDKMPNTGDDQTQPQDSQQSQDLQENSKQPQLQQEQKLQHEQQEQQQQIGHQDAMVKTMQAQMMMMQRMQEMMKKQQLSDANKMQQKEQQQTQGQQGQMMNVYVNGQSALPTKEQSEQDA